MKFERVGDLVFASGDGWKYERVGELPVFTQNKKVPSLRVIKTLLKEMEKVTNGIQRISC